MASLLTSDRISRSKRLQLGVTGMPVRPPRQRRFVQYSEGFHRQGDTSEKRQQRQMAVDHILGFKLNVRIRMFSLPGETWAVEHEILKTHPYSGFVACERDPVTFTRSVPFIPNHRLYSRAIYGHLSVPNSGDSEYYGNHQAVLFGCDAADFLAIDTPPEAGRDSILKCARNNYTAWWIDSFSPLGTERSLYIYQRMLAKTSKFGSAFAIAFTLGRDDPKVCRVIDVCPGADAVDRRANFLLAMAKNSGRVVSISNVHRHRSWNSEGSLTIGTIFGIVHPSHTSA